jgi:predicted DNA-binding transcriptional regulator YafY
MSKIANAFRMLLLLKSRGRMQIKELAEELELSERIIRVYRDQLEMAGFHIHTTRGRHGGYYLSKSNIFEYMSLSQKELTSLVQACEQLKHNQTFLHYDELKSAVMKIQSISKQQVQAETPQNPYILEEKANIDLEQEKEKYEILYEAMLTRKKVKIVYESLKTGRSERVIHPYNLIPYKNFWYCVGYCELRKAFRDFKLTRILEYKVCNEKFHYDESFRLEDFIGKTSIYADTYEVVLHVQPPFSTILSETIYSEDQEIEYKDHGSIIFRATMSGLPELTRFVLSMGSAVEVISPDKLREAVKQEVKKMTEKILN